MVILRKGYTFSFVLIILIIVVASAAFYLTHNNSTTSVNLSPGSSSKSVSAPQDFEPEKQEGPSEPFGAPGKQVSHLGCIFNSTNCTNMTVVNSSGTTIINTCLSFCGLVPGPGSTPPICTSSGVVCNNVTNVTFIPTICNWQLGPQLRITNDSNVSKTPSVALDFQKNVHMVWEDAAIPQVGSPFPLKHIYYAKLNSSGSFLIAPKMIHIINITGTSHLSQPKVLVNGSGTPTIIFINSTQINNNLSASGRNKIITEVKLDNFGNALATYQLFIQKPGMELYFDAEIDQTYTHLLISNYSSNGSFSSGSLFLEEFSNGIPSSTFNSIISTNFSEISPFNSLALGNGVDVAYFKRGGAVKIGHKPFTQIGIPLGSGAVANTVNPTAGKVNLLKDSQGRLHFLTCMVPNTIFGIYFGSLNYLTLNQSTSSTFNPIISYLGNDCILPVSSMFAEGGQDATIDPNNLIHTAYASTGNLGSPGQKSEIYYNRIENNMFSSNVQISDSGIANSKASNPTIDSKDKTVFIAWQDGRHIPTPYPLSYQPANYEIYGRFYNCL